LLDEGTEQTREIINGQGMREEKVVRKGLKREVTERELEELERSRDVGLAKVVRYRVRYFSDGAVLGSRNFVNGVFEACRWRFGPRRKDGARAMRGVGSGAKGVLWSARDLRVRV
ncbi:MAG: hypothetical protein K9N23_13990, partial [Akkermansiaceae bacterium]|nr:hypothetical protein [Akkermansiaceae bacterium]